MPVAPISPPMPNRMTVAGNRSEMNAIDSPKASTNTIGAAQTSWSWTNARIASPMASGADVAGSRRRSEAADGFREHVLRQPQHRFGDEDGEGDDGEED